MARDKIYEETLAKFAREDEKKRERAIVGRSPRSSRPLFSSDSTYEAELRKQAAETELVSAVLKLVVPPLVSFVEGLLEKRRARLDAAEKEFERKAQLLEQEERDKEEYYNLVSEGRIEEAAERLPHIDLLINPKHKG